MSRKHLFSDRVGRILPSATLEMTAKAAELKRLKKPVYNMSVGEPDFPTPKNIQQAGIYAIKNGIPICIVGQPNSGKSTLLKLLKFYN